MRIHPGYVIITVLLAVLAASCSNAGEQEPEPTLLPEPTATVILPTPTPTPETLIVCLQDEPDSLYLYGASSREADTVLQAVYDGPYDLLGYEFESVILEEIPESGTDNARVVEVTVTSGDRYLNPVSMLPDTFKYGKPYRPAGCTSPQCQQTFIGGEVQMDQLEVLFRLRSGVTWSDGEPLNAADSVFSYNLDRHPDTPGSKYIVDRTRSYEAVDELGVLWVGIPGFLDPDYAANFWSPLPEHLLDGQEPAALLDLPEAAREPVGWGPYVIDTWQDGQITLSRNPMYFRGSEGLPYFDRLVFRFLGDQASSALEQLVTGECDVLDEALIPYNSLEQLIDLEGQGQLSFTWNPGSVLERIDFNTAPLNSSAPPVFTDPSIRLAVSTCIDRQGLVEDVLYGLGAVPDTYLPSSHPLSAPEAVYPEYDPAAAAALLEQAGWTVDPESSSGIRMATAAWNVTAGTPLSFTLQAVDGALQRRVAAAIQEDLALCGVEMKVEFAPSGDLFASWPDGEVFSRKFSSVLWAWPVFSSPPCEMYESAQIPSDTSRYGINASGFSDAVYDQSCGAVQLGLPDDPRVVEASAITAGILAEKLPGLPLFERPRIAAHASDVCGVDVNPSAFSVLWNLEELYRGVDCTTAAP